MCGRLRPGYDEEKIDYLSPQNVTSPHDDNVAIDEAPLEEDIIHKSPVFRSISVNPLPIMSQGVSAEVVGYRGSSRWVSRREVSSGYQRIRGRTNIRSTL